MEEQALRSWWRAGVGYRAGSTGEAPFAYYVILRLGLRVHKIQWHPCIRVTPTLKSDDRGISEVSKLNANPLLAMGP